MHPFGTTATGCYSSAAAAAAAAAASAVRGASALIEGGTGLKGFEGFRNPGSPGPFVSTVNNSGRQGVSAQYVMLTF